MSISFKKLIETPLPYRMAPGRSAPHGTPQDIILYTMGRMVRNLQGHPFPGWSSAQDRKAVADILLPALEALPVFKSHFEAEMRDLTHEQRLVLLERKQLTPSMAARQDGCHILISRDQGYVAMVNEEEHLCVHTALPDLDAKGVLKRLHGLDERLAESVKFATNATDGYLTSIPTEAGEGLQLYAVMHMPALTRAEMIGATRNALEKLNLCLAPYYSEADEDVGNLYVLYTRAIPKGGEEDAVKHFTEICDLLAYREQSLQYKYSLDLQMRDDICRAYGQLRYSHVMDFREMANLLSLVRVGVKLGMFRAGAEYGARYGMTNHRALLLNLYETQTPATLRYLHQDIDNRADALRTRSRSASFVMSRIVPAFED